MRESASPGVIGVDLVNAVSGCKPRRRWPRKKRQNYKREHSTVRARGLVATTSAYLLPDEIASGETYSGLPTL